MRRFEGYQKGINLGGWLSQCVSYSKEHFDGFITKKDIENILLFVHYFRLRSKYR